MTNTTPAVTISHPPVSLLHAANPIVRRLLRIPLARRLRDQVMVVGDLAHRCARAYGARRAQRMMGLKLRDLQVPAAADFVDMVNREHYFAIRFTPTGWVLLKIEIAIAIADHDGH